MLVRAREALSGYRNISYVPGGGTDLAGIDTGSVDAVFSYIVLQHVPTVAGQLAYLRESRRVLRPGGVAAIQIRSNTPTARGLDWPGICGTDCRAAGPWTRPGGGLGCLDRNCWPHRPEPEPAPMNATSGRVPRSSCVP